jgi:hypothetical protein
MRKLKPNRKQISRHKLQRGLTDLRHHNQGLCEIQHFAIGPTLNGYHTHRENQEEDIVIADWEILEARKS